jgi:hypothetical protein
MQPARASAIAAVVFTSVGLVGAAAALTYAHQDIGQGPSTTAVAHKDKSKPDHGDKGHSDQGHGADASAAGRAHADAMKAWARCVANAASGPKAEGAAVPPKTACDDKPVAPGRAKHDDQGNGEAHGKSGDHGKPDAHGKSGAHQH